MVQRTGSASNDEPEQKQFKMPSEGKHLFQVVDIVDNDDPDIALVKLEVSGGDEEGRTLLNRLTLDEQAKGYWATQIFLRAIGEPYKGAEFPIDSDNWIGRQMYATVVHNKSKDGTKTYANIAEYNFDKVAPSTACDNTPGADGPPKTEKEVE